MRSFNRRVALAGASIVVAGIAFVSSALPAGSSQTPGVNGMIQYSAFADTSGGIHLVNPDGSGDRVLVADGLGGSTDASSSRLTFATWSSGASANELRYIEMDGSGGGVIATTTGTDFIDFSTLSPDGTKVAYVLHTNSNTATDLLMSNIDGSGLVNLTNGAYDVAAPQFSPDGTKILFAGLSSGVRQLFVLDVSTLVTTQLTFAAHPLYNCSWKPDGSGYIAVSMSSPGGEIVSVSLDGSTITTLFDSSTVGSGNLFWAMLSPDGTKIVFSAARLLFLGANEPSVANPYDLWVSNVDGTNAVMIVQGVDLGAWAPGWTTYQTVPDVTTTAAPAPVTPKITG